MTAPPTRAGVFRAGDRREVAPRSRGTRVNLLTWVLVRLTGLLLTVLVLGHFALTHIINDVAETDAAFVARRWGSALWLAWDWSLLAAALVHGAAGTWVAIADYTPAGARRRRLRLLLVAVSALLFLAGSATIAAAILD